MSQQEVKYYGVHACLALWEHRPQDIIRVYVEASKLKMFSPLLKWCAEEKKAYHVIPTEELSKVTQSVHHEGVCLLAKELAPISFSSIPFQDISSCLLYLDGVQNPHNVGSIVRSCAYFDIPYILGDEKKLPPLSPSAYRIAKGGAEKTFLIPMKNPAFQLKKLQEQGFSLIATSCHHGNSLYQYTFPKKSILILGSEDLGISPPVLSLAQELLKIPGSKNIESLNVAVATGVFLGEYFRQKIATR